MAISTGILTTAGITALAKTLYSSTADHALYLAYGTGTTAAVAGDTELENEIDRAAATTVEKTGSTFRAHKDFVIAEDCTVSEIGLFDSADGGNMIYHGIAGSSCRNALIIGDTYDGEVVITPEQGTF